MALSMTACQNEPVADDGTTGSAQGGEDMGKNASDDEGSSADETEDTQVSWDVQALDLHLPWESGAAQAETPEQVLKLTVSSTGTARKQFIDVQTDAIEIPAGSTFEYDVLLETPVEGMGIFDIKINTSVFLSKKGLADTANIGLDMDADDLTNYAYDRWYHRIFELPADEEGMSCSMLRITAGGLTAGCTNICYYDNLCIKDPDGNTIYEFDKESIASTAVAETTGVSVSLDIVDDPLSADPRDTADAFAKSCDAAGVSTGSDKIDLTFCIDSAYSAPGIYIGTPDESCLLGIRGYVVALNNGNIVLYRSAEYVSLLASSVVVGADIGKELSIRLETDGNIIRGYYLDDMEGVEPWPEFELAVEEDLTGKTFGALDVYGRGCTLNTLSYAEYTPETYENVYTNPVQDDLADPDILYYDGVYYMYCTYAGFAVLSSTDLVNWEMHGSCMDTDFTWSSEPMGWYWAPDVEYYNGKFYMVASIDSHLGIAVSDSPLGPFIPETESLFEDAIDGHLFIDDDGQAYIYFAYQGRDGDIYGVKFDMTTLQADYDSLTRIIAYSDRWESYNSDDEVYKASTTEGPYMIKHNGKYYMTYSGSDYRTPRYAVGYAVSDSPLGVFEKYEGNPIQIGNAVVHGTAHHCFTTTPDGELLIVYHQHKSLTEVDARKISVDRARFAPTESGVDRIETYGPTTTPQEMPLS